MDLHIILIVLIILILVILVAHGLWSSRREKSQLFKSANTFTYDSRTKYQDPLDHDIDAPISNISAKQHDPLSPTALDSSIREEYSETEVTPLHTPHSTKPQVSVEQAVSSIRITLPQQPVSESIQSAVSSPSGTISGAESLSRSSLLNRTIADLEQEIDSEEGINTSSAILREELARVTQQNKITISEPAATDNRYRANPAVITSTTSAAATASATTAPTTAAETVRAQLNPETLSATQKMPNEPAASEQPHLQSSIAEKPKTEEKPKTVVLYIVAPQNQTFQGIQIVQSLESLGFLYGKHSLYHRHLDLDGNSPVLFSAANMLNPGVFDLDNIAEFRTIGLVLFMHLPSHGNDLANFRLLLRAAQTLAEQLHGQVLNDKRQPFDEASKAYYLNLIS